MKLSSEFITMKKKFSVWHRIQRNIYKQIEFSDETIEVLDIILNDELAFRAFIDFLENNELHEFVGNVSSIVKVNEYALIRVDGYIYST